VIYAQNLAIEDFGIFYGLFGFFVFFGFFRDWGMNSAVIFFANKYHAEGRLDKIKTLFWFNQFTQLGLSLIIGLILYFSREFIFKTFYPIEQNISQIFIIFIFYWITFTVHSTNSIFFTIFQNQKINAYLEIAYFAVILIISVLFLYLKISNFLIPAYAYLISSITMVIISTVYILVKYKDILITPLLYKHKNLFKEVFRYSSSVIVAGVAGTLLLSTDKIIIQYFEAAEVVALYSVAFSTALLLTIFVSPFQRVIQPIIASKWHLKEVRVIEGIMSSILNNYLMFILPLVLSFIVFADNFILAVYGKSFINASFIIRVLALGVLFITINSFISIILSSIGKPKLFSRIVVVTGICNIVLSIAFINFWGVIGVAIATVFSSILRLFMLAFAVKKFIRLKIDFVNNLKIIFSSFFFLLFSLFLKNTIYHIYTNIVILNFVLNCAIIFSLASTVYLAILIFLKVITRSKYNYLRELLKQKDN
jgi:O-antigen/teichoic acid export membrane protein